MERIIIVINICAIKIIFSSTVRSLVVAFLESPTVLEKIFAVRRIIKRLKKTLV